MSDPLDRFRDFFDAVIADNRSNKWERLVDNEEQRLFTAKKGHFRKGGHFRPFGQTSETSSML